MQVSPSAWVYIRWYNTAAHVLDSTSKLVIHRRITGVLFIEFGRWLTQQEWSSDYASRSVHEQNLILTDKILDGMNIFFSLKSATLHNSDKPWMCSSIKGNIPLWRHYRNKVKQAIIIQKQSFYSEKVRHLKQSDSRLWWKLVKILSGNTSTSTSFQIEKKTIYILTS